MRAPARQPAEPARAAPTPDAAARQPRQLAALAVQRRAGNRVAGRLLARWAAHPDKEQKGVMVPDSVASEYAHFNPPKNA